MGMVEHNDVHDALGIGIYCGDRSMCEIEHNVVSTRGPTTRRATCRAPAIAIVAWWESEATLHENVSSATARRGLVLVVADHWPR